MESVTAGPTEKWWVMLRSQWVSGDSFCPTKLVRNYYAGKRAVVKRLSPVSICEIGVRAGYSALTFLGAMPGVRYVGIDNASCGQRLLAHARRVLQEQYPGTSLLVIADSLSLEELPGGPYDLVHIDGDHSREGVLSDLLLAAKSGTKWLLVDDFDVETDDPGVARVRDGCRDFLLSHSLEWRAEYLPDPLVSSLLLTRQQKEWLV